MKTIQSLHKTEQLRRIQALWDLTKTPFLILHVFCAVSNFAGAKRLVPDMAENVRNVVTVVMTVIVIVPVITAAGIVYTVIAVIVIVVHFAYASHVTAAIALTVVVEAVI